ncbi:carbohydrate ABC transporter permease [Globicatella sp. PHS-GS-PNBC-21-1553]|uniref:carbohydrate ABC transporter permease n=1 Tax=Globicatella sp. PHS-GS-PNBC-21-1553 TaxID=2885764 RepID=UPI00298EF6DE|nr:carbohydrate ABC transporter permease [Globicatella sp. PHS-GS-PNBC-21-1553]WPC09640.1 carbohydrate ABC transporter permease [Globicatella sp. PHS-GS-PNBC-21-1553]
MALRKVGINPSRFDKSQIKYYIILAPFVAFMVLPIIFIVNHAFKPMGELFAFPPTFFVKSPTLDNFENLFKASQQTNVPFSRYLFNSIVITIIVVFVSVLISSMAAYVLSKKEFRGKKWGLELNNAALMFVPTAVTIPRYLVISVLGMENTILAHILPLLAMPVGLFLIKQFIDQIPNELIEAGYIDGASEWTIFSKVILPLIRPAIATAALLIFQVVWNNMETSDLFITDEAKRTLAFYLGTFATQTNIVVGQGIAAAASLIMFLPNILLFVLLQSKVMNTMSHSGIK